MDYIEMTKECKLCRLANNDVSCKECQELGRCQLEVNND
jgi:hypothetical protein